LSFHERSWESPLFTRGVHSNEPPERLYAGTNFIEPRVSRDGQWLLATIAQKGLVRIASNGSAPIQVLSADPSAAGHCLSPDGQQVAFTIKTGTRHAVQVVPVQGGNPKRLTNETYSEGRPHWSADGRSLYFYSDREGVPGIYRLPWPIAGQTPVLILRRGIEAAESPDGQRIYVLPHEQDARLLVRSTDGGSFQPVEGMPSVEPGHWGCLRDGIYFSHAARDHSTETGFLPYGSGLARLLPDHPAKRIGPEHLLGFTLDWTGERLFWCEGRTPTFLHLADA
jgi:hypothetical protein